MPDVTTMLFCEQVADVAIHFVLGFDIVDILLDKPYSVSPEIVDQVKEQFLSTELSDHEFVNSIYEQCLEGEL